jgi:hypothetical protein
MVRILMVVLKPTPGIAVRTSARGWGLQASFEVSGQVGSLTADITLLGCDAGDDPAELGSAWHENCLCVQGEQDLGRQCLGHLR